MVSHSLPFGATLGDELVVHIRRHDDAFREAMPDTVPSLTWAEFHPYSGPDGEGWALLPLETDYTRPEDIFTVAGVSVHISVADQERMLGRTLDLKTEEGVVDVTPTI